MPRAASRAGPTRTQMYDYFASDIHGKMPASARMLARYMPGALVGYYQLRRATTHETSLPKPVRELIIIAVQAALKKDPSGHARSAVDAGVSPKEIHDACALVLWLAGMPAYQVGMLAVAAAQMHAARLKRASRRRPSRAGRRHARGRRDEPHRPPVRLRGRAAGRGVVRRDRGRRRPRGAVGRPVRA